MLKKDIVKELSRRFGLSQTDARKIVQGTFDAIIDALEDEGRIELRNFGVFEVKVRKARKARNPRTRDVVSVPEKKVVTFKPGRIMKARISHSPEEEPSYP